MKTPARPGRGGRGSGVKQLELFEPTPFSPTPSHLSIVPRVEVAQPECSVGATGEQVLSLRNSRDASVLQGETIDPRLQGCTCLARGECLVCRSWIAYHRACDLRGGAA